MDRATSQAAAELDTALAEARARLGEGARIVSRLRDGLYEVHLSLGEPDHGRVPQWGVAAHDPRHVLDQVPLAAARLAGDRALLAVRRPLEAPLHGPALLTPAAAGVLVHECFGHTSEADNYLTRPRSAGRLGDRLTPAPLTVRDRPGLLRFAGSYRRDDEGTRARTVTLLDRGRWSGLLTGRSTAWLSGGASTGHARGPSGATAPRCSVLEAAPGPYAPAGLRRWMGDGWLWGTPIGGFSVEGRLIVELLWVRRVRSGVVTGEVRGPAVVCAGKRALAAGLVAVGNDPTVHSSPYRCVKAGHEVGSTLITPSMLLRRAVLRPLADLAEVVGRSGL